MKKVTEIYEAVMTEADKYVIYNTKTGESDQKQMTRNAAKKLVDKKGEDWKIANDYWYHDNKAKLKKGANMKKVTEIYEAVMTEAKFDAIAYLDNKIVDKLMLTKLNPWHKSGMIHSKKVGDQFEISFNSADKDVAELLRAKATKVRESMTNEAKWLPSTLTSSEQKAVDKLADVLDSDQMQTFAAVVSLLELTNAHTEAKEINKLLSKYIEESVTEGAFSEIDLELNEIVEYIIGLIDKGLVSSKKEMAIKIKEVRNGQLGTTWSKDARKNTSEIMKRLTVAMKKQKITLK